MTRTISRTRLQRGTQSTRTRDVVPGDAVAPRRRRLNAVQPAAEPAAASRTRLPAENTRGTRARSLASESPEAPPPKRRSRAHTAAIGSLEPGHEGVAASLENTNVRGPSTGGPAARERSKLSRIRDGRYARSRSRFIV